MYKGGKLTKKHANNDNFSCFWDKFWEIRPKNRQNWSP